MEDQSRVWSALGPRQRPSQWTEVLLQQVSSPRRRQQQEEEEEEDLEQLDLVAGDPLQLFRLSGPHLGKVLFVSSRCAWI